MEFKDTLGQLGEVSSQVEKVVASMSPASGSTGSPFTKVTDVTIKDRVDPQLLELLQMAGLSC